MLKEIKNKLGIVFVYLISFGMVGVVMAVLGYGSMKFFSYDVGWIQNMNQSFMNTGLCVACISLTVQFIILLMMAFEKD